MILITGSARPNAADRQRVLAAVRRISVATQADPGCIYYMFSASIDSDDIISIELWRDRASLDAHMSHDHTKQFLAGLDGALAGAPVMSEIEL